MNGDQLTDLVLANRNGQANRIYYGPSFKESSLFGTKNDETRGVVLTDMNGDNYLDIVVANILETKKVHMNAIFSLAVSKIKPWQ